MPHSVLLFTDSLLWNNIANYVMKGRFYVIDP